MGTQNKRKRDNEGAVEEGQRRKKRIVRPEDLLDGATVGTKSSGGNGNGNVLNYVVIDDIPDKRIIGTIVNIAAYFHVGLVGIDIEAIAGMAGLASYNKKLFGAGTLRIFLNLPNNFYSGNYERDMEMLLKHNKIDSMEEFNHLMKQVELERECKGEAPPLKMKYPSQNLTGLLFDSGRIVLIGASNEYLARYGASLIVYMLQKYRNIPARFSNFRIVNIVTTFSLGFDVDLEKFAAGEGTLVNYIPDLFPAVMMPSPNNMTLLVNYTGNCILTGSRDRRVLKEFFKKQYYIIIKYRKKTKAEEYKEYMKNKQVSLEHGAAGRALVTPGNREEEFPQLAIPMEKSDGKYDAISNEVMNRGGTEEERQLCKDVMGLRDTVLEFMSKATSMDKGDKSPEKKEKVNSRMNAYQHIHKIIESLDEISESDRATAPPLRKIGKGTSDEDVRASIRRGPSHDHHHFYPKVPTILNRSIQRMSVGHF